jgi:hypothetical protein
MHNVNKFFDKIFVMSPKHNKARRAYIEGHFQERGITNWEFHDAIDYKLLTKEARTFLSSSGLLLEEGYPWLPLNDTQVVACLSFMQMLLKAKHNHCERILHLEDDVFFYKDYDVLFDEAISNLPDDWDAIHFYSHIPIGSKKYNDEYREKINDHIHKGFSEGSGALCIGYNRRAIDLMFTRIFPLESGIDGVANTASGNWYHRHEEYTAYICSKFLCKENKNLPNTHDKVSKGKPTRKADDNHIIPPHMTTEEEKKQLEEEAKKPQRWKDVRKRNILRDDE